MESDVCGMLTFNGIRVICIERVECFLYSALAHVYMFNTVLHIYLVNILKNRNYTVYTSLKRFPQIHNIVLYTLHVKYTCPSKSIASGFGTYAFLWFGIFLLLIFII